jgi:uncharacterized membrane protein YvbJ
MDLKLFDELKDEDDYLFINANILVPRDQIVRIDEEEHNLYLITPIGIFVAPKGKTNKIRTKGIDFDVNWEGIEANKDSLLKDLRESFFIDLTKAWYEMKGELLKKAVGE